MNQSREYWSQARQPLACLVFLLPLLAVYEAGVIWLGGSNPSAVRNGADYWMRGWLYQVGLDYAFLLPLLVTGGLLAWHVWGRYPWRISFDTLVGMFAESLLFAFCLVLLGQLQDLVFQRWLAPDATLDGTAVSMGTAAIASPMLAIMNQDTVARLVSFVGAGVYEEVMFRLCLLPACYGVFRVALTNKWSAVLAVLTTSLLFALAHYVGVSGDEFSLFSFTFRALAGFFFAALFMIRGFGITVGCHAAYDVLVGILLAAQA